MGVFSNIVNEKYSKACKQVESNLNFSSNLLFQSFYSIAINAFKWKNLPENVLEFLPEEYLIFAGRMGFFRRRSEYKMLPIFPTGTLLENGEYTSYNAIAKNGEQYLLSRDEISICYNNSLQLPTISIIEEWANRAGYSLSAVDSSLLRAITPDIVAVDNKEILDSLTTMWDKEKKLIPYNITANENFLDENKFKRIAMYDSRERNVLEQWEVFEKYRGFFQNLYGVYSIGVRKNERLTTSEATGNTDNVRYSFYDDMLYNRQSFCEDVKKRFNYDLQVETNRSIPVTKEEIEEQQEEEK